MKTKFTMILTLFMALIVQLTFAQEKTVSGIVSDENGLPLIGTTVLIVGSSSGTTVLNIPIKGGSATTLPQRFL